MSSAAAAAAAPLPRRTKTRPPAASRKPEPDTAGLANGAAKPSSKPTSPNHVAERIVKKLRLSKALTIPEGTMVSDACRRMASRRVDAVLLTDPHGLLSGIVTDKDVATRVIAEGLRPDQTVISKVMTRHPVYVMAESPAIEALQKMVQGKFRHLPVVENGEVIAMLDIAKCLYDAISRLEKAAEQGSAIAAAVEGVERHWGSNFSAPYALIETLREKMFKPSLSTIITDNTKVPIVSPADPVYLATKKMREFRMNSVVVVAGGALQGIFTSKDVLMRVVAQNLSPELTLVEKVMTMNPACATLDMTILDALHIMHDGRFLHIPVLDREGQVTACLDVLQLTHAAISMAEGESDTVNDVASTIMQKFWDSAFALDPVDDDLDSRSEVSLMMTSDGAAEGKTIYPIMAGNLFSFKLEDKKGRKHRFSCGTENLAELHSTVKQRLGIDDDEKLQLLYEDDEGDCILLMTDNDLATSVLQARSSGLKALRLHLEESTPKHVESSKPLGNELALARKNQSLAVKYGIVFGAVAVTGIAVFAYLRRSNA